MFASIPTRLPRARPTVLRLAVRYPCDFGRVHLVGRVTWITLWTWREYFAIGDVAEGPSTVFNVTFFSNLGDQTQAWSPSLALTPSENHRIINLMTQLPLRSLLDSPPLEHVPPAFTPEPRQRRAIRKPAVPRRIHEIRANGNLDRVETSDILGEEDSNATLREVHKEARRRRDAAALIDKSPPSTSPEEAKFIFTATLPAESRTWNELSSMSSLDAPPPNLNLQPSSPVSIPPTSTFGRRALTDSSPERPLFANSCSLSGSFLTPPTHGRARFAFVRYTPLMAVLYHWVIETMFMYMFAILLGGCRRIMRSGAMWFIKDPQNQNMHPIRDILERPTFTHLYKLFQNVRPIAATVQVETEGTVVDCSIQCGVHTPHPSLHHPLLPAPNSCLTNRYRPTEVALKEAGCLIVHVWRAASGQGGFEMIHRSKSDAQEPQREGGWRRVSANANITIVRGVRATVEVTEDGRPIDEADARLLELENAEVEQHKRNVDEDYTLAYKASDRHPSAIAAALAEPVLLGRRLFLPFAVQEIREIHDGPSNAPIAAGNGGRTDLMPSGRFSSLNAVRCGLAQAAYMAFFLVFAIPTLIASVMEMYVLLPIKLIYDPNLVVKVKLAEMWVLGLFYAKIILRLPGFEAPQRMNEGIQRINRNGWSRPDPMTATKEVIGPAVGGLLAMLAFPVGMVWIFKLLINYRITDRALFISIYPGVFTGVGVVRGILGLRNAYLKWSQTVRDKELLVEMRLRNLEPEETKERAVEKKEE
ncbi:hypothetical protein BDM02DRAFT_3263386 [Thelephora ganbajun]|uniref:Uncharacterized protein n=1 Tax=Thelephora ganbajun TaxID=370292 RepID=A0ACB6Z5S4_THEGA|nr:hypothetical protein BDM02DRAFT_3263386 [Thelephora ganbajun]